MTTGGGKPPRRRRGLSDDDVALWDYVTRDVEPVRGKPRVGAPLPEDAAVPSRPRERVEPRTPAEPARKPPDRKAPPPEARKPAPEPRLVVLERRKARRLARGTEEIEARLDLHGMTQEAAHLALSGFIRRCHADGLRVVLVITGKGGGRDDARDGDYVSRPRGVLRQNVPRWLGGAD